MKMKIFYWVALVLILSCNQPPQNQQLKTTYIHPASGYTQVVVSEYNGLKTIEISGQVGEGDTLEEQMANALRSLQRQLQAAGADFEDVVKMNHYIVDYKPEHLDTFRNTRKKIMGDENMPASTLLGVTSLFAPGYLIEIDATARVMAK